MVEVNGDRNLWILSLYYVYMLISMYEVLRGDLGFGLVGGSWIGKVVVEDRSDGDSG